MQQLHTPPTSLSSPFISLSSLIKWTISPSYHHLHLSLPMTIPSFYAAVPPPPPPPLTSANKPNFVSTNFTTIGLGYAIAIAFGFLVLFSTVLLASYICCRSIAARRRRRRLDAEAGYRNSHPDDNGVYLPRIIFVAEDDEENDGVSGQNVALGLDQAVINSYPKLVYSKRSGNPGNDTLCSICLCEYKDSEMLRMLPDCKHYFHVTCIDAWLKLNASCPVCRNSPLPTPLSTPLSEVVPLSQYSDGRRRQ